MIWWVGITNDAYYAYLKRLGIKAEKEREGKAYLTEAIVERSEDVVPLPPGTTVSPASTRPYWAEHILICQNLKLGLEWNGESWDDAMTHAK